MNNELERAQDRFIEYISRLCETFGLNKVVAQLYAILYLNGDEKLSLDEMAEMLSVAKSNVSVNIRILENWGVVSKIWVKGSRKDYYKANPDVEKIFLGKVKSSVNKKVDDLSRMIDESKKIINSRLKEFTPEEKVKAGIYLEKLDKIENIKNVASKFLTVADTFFTIDKMKI